MMKILGEDLNTNNFWKFLRRKTMNLAKRRRTLSVSQFVMKRLLYMVKNVNHLMINVSFSSLFREGSKLNATTKWEEGCKICPNLI